MPKKSLHPALQAVFDEHAAPTHCGTALCIQMLAPSEDTIAALRMQLTVYRNRLRAAELAPDMNPEITGKTELIRREIKSASAAVEAYAAQTETVTDALRRLDRVMTEAFDTLSQRDALA